MGHEEDRSRYGRGSLEDSILIGLADDGNSSGLASGLAFTDAIRNNNA